MRTVDGRRLSDRERHLRSRCRVALCALFLASCSAASTVAPRVPESPPANEQPEPPASAQQYASAVRPDGVVGGPRAARLAKQIREALRARGDAATRRRPGHGGPGSAAEPGRPAHGAGELALREGFRGLVLSAVSSSWMAATETPGARPWRASQATCRSAATAFTCHRTASRRWFSENGGEPRSVPAALPSRRNLPAAWTAGVTPRAGARLPPPARRQDRRNADSRTQVDLTLPLSGTGVYRLEVMSAGAGGPAVLANVPIYVGVDEPARALPSRVGARPMRSKPRHAC